MKSIKPGRGPSMMGGIGAVAVVICGIIWTLAAVSMGAPIFFPLFGLVFIGMGIANAVTRLKDSKAKSKVIILLTDGSNNRGDISPLTAAEIAKQFGIRIYTIGVGTNGTAPYPMQTYAGTQYVNVPVEIDEKTLTEIAGTTNGNYFRATSNSKLKEVYQEIDKLEKTKLNVKEFSKREEEYQVFAWIAFFCILLELLLRNSVLKKIP